MRWDAVLATGLLVVALLLSGCGSKNTGGGAPANQVSIEDFAFKPATFNVTKGTKVVWRNLDSTAHSVKSEGSGPLSSGLISTGQTYSFTFDAAGTFAYYCEPHPTDMKAVIRVA